MKIGVLAAQGAFAEHVGMLHRLEVDAEPVRLSHQLDGLDALVIPGFNDACYRLSGTDEDYLRLYALKGGFRSNG
jgi:glutamine amidotransferase PdxT